jgi:alpha-beta hydrolase superfamily lysophospholipase
MSAAETNEIGGTKGKIMIHRWRGDEPRFVVLLAHGYGEHAGRYQHVAERLVAEGAAVYSPDHLGHGLSEGERAMIETVEDLVDDFALVGRIAADEHPGLPVIVLGHSMGGIVATAFVQRDPSPFAALILSGPAIGGNPDLIGLLELDPIPDVPIDPASLSRDPAVGEAYAGDELVYHGPFKRETLTAMNAANEAIAAGPKLDELPLLWVHGSADAVVPLETAREAVHGLGAADLEEHVYEGAAHEVFNETNKDEVLDHVAAFANRVTGSR